MNDVIIDNTSTSLENGEARRKNSSANRKKQKNKRSFSGFLLDWVEKAMIIGCLFSIDFLLFAGSGSYKMFESSTFLALEAWYILAGIFIVAFSLMCLVSFSSFFQNVITSIVFGVFAVVFLNQFAAVDKNTLIMGFVSQYIPTDIAMVFGGFSYLIFSFLMGILF